MPLRRFMEGIHVYNYNEHLLFRVFITIVTHYWYYSSIDLNVINYDLMLHLVVF